VVGLAAIAAVAGMLNPDKITVGDGFGWDGKLYRAFAENFWEARRGGLSDYCAGRVAPSLLLHYTLRAVSAPPTKANLLHGFEVMDVLLLVGSAWLWTRVARRMGLGPTGLWFGFIGAFANFFALKAVSYYPTLTDVPAFFLGWAMLAAYLRGSAWLLVVLTLVGRFTWPMALPMGAILLLFPKSPSGTSNDEPAPRIPLSWRAGALAAVPALAVGCFVGQVMAKGIPLIAGHNGMPGLFKPAWPLSLAGSCVYLAVALFLLFRATPSLLGFFTYARLLGRWSTYLKLAILVGLALVVKPLATRGPDPIDAVTFLKYVAWYSVAAPLKFLVAHVDYYGPVVLVLVLGWRAVARAIGAAGTGIGWVVALAVMLSLNSESRHLVMFVPFLVAFAAKAVDEQPPARRTLWIFAGLSILASKAWLVIGTDVQLYLSNFGPWMSNERYALDGVVLLVLAFWCARSDLVPRLPPARSPAPLP
jgi:hypothetical protein